MRWPPALPLLLALALAGCAAQESLPPRDLVAATHALAVAQASPYADAATEELADAEALLTAAERDQALRPTSFRAADSAYLARRAAELARLAGVYAADREALDKARSAAENLRAALVRRDALIAAVERRREDDTQARAALHRAHLRALETARGLDAEIVERPDGLVFRLSVEQTFLPGTSLLRTGADDRLASLARALASAPRPLEIRLQVLDDLPGAGTGAALLAARRLQRLHDVLRRRGVPAGVFLAPRRHPPPGAQVDVLVEDPPVLVPSREQGPS